MKMLQEKIRAISGIQPSNKITLGNYLGAIKQLVELQDKYELFIFIADLHSISNVIIEPSQLKINRDTLLKTYAALGLDFSKTHIFFQSDIPAHCELNWILTCNSTVGELNRMTQFKDKIQNLKTHNNTEMAPTGIFMYPILMAADIILYDAKLVIVGSDQKQHIELTRDIVQRMNKKYNLNISVPEPYIPKIGARIMDLLCPTIKMSKSNKNENGTIFLLDKIDIVKQKIMKAKTDLLNHVHFDPLNQPGISNLMSIYSCLSNMSYEEIEKIHDKKSYAIFKQNLAELLTQFLKSFQKKYECVDLNKIKKTLKENAKHCSRIANANLDIIKQAVGLKND